MQLPRIEGEHPNATNPEQPAYSSALPTMGLSATNTPSVHLPQPAVNGSAAAIPSVATTTKRPSSPGGPEFEKKAKIEESSTTASPQESVPNSSAISLDQVPESSIGEDAREAKEIPDEDNSVNENTASESAGSEHAPMNAAGDDNNSVEHVPVSPPEIPEKNDDLDSNEIEERHGDVAEDGSNKDTATPSSSRQGPMSPTSTVSGSRETWAMNDIANEVQEAEEHA
jgi:hypothetical protein